MRTIGFVLAGLGLTGSGLVAAEGAWAQTAQNTPESIICAMTGSCDAPVPSADGRVRVGNEKAFSLALPGGGSATRATPASTARRPATARAVRRSVRPARVAPGGGIDMLVTFNRNSAEMTQQARAEAQAFARAMAAPQMAGLRFAIEGHTDASGTHDHNITLSQQRAQAVMDFLVTQGVDPTRLSARGFGPDRPLQGVPARAAANRRVEFVKQS